jgi:hypothetical protein
MDDVQNQSLIDEVRSKVLEICQRFPVYSE